jgi:hypothetical protein
MTQVTCVFCGGSGTQICGFCGGSARRYFGGACDSCGGRGVEECCGPCHGGGLVEENLVNAFPAQWLADAAETHAALCTMARAGRPNRVIALLSATAFIRQHTDSPLRRTLATSIALAVTRIVVGTGKYVLSDREEELCQTIFRSARNDAGRF